MTRLDTASPRQVLLLHRGRASRGARRGMTLIEVVIATAVLAILVLATFAAAWPLTRATNTATLALDMDREARDFFAVLRREVRQSGWNSTGAAQWTTAPAFLTGSTGSVDRDGDGSATAANEANLPRQFTFRMRTGPLDADWTPNTTYYSVVSDGRRDVLRLRGDAATAANQTTVLRNVQELVFRADATASTIEVILVLERNDPHATTADGRVIRRLYEERVNMQNINPND